MTDAYCLKCKCSRLIEDEERVVTSNKRNAIKGKCSVCATKMFKFISAKEIKK